MNELARSVSRRFAELHPKQRPKFILALGVYSMRHVARVVEDFVFDLRWLGRTVDFGLANRWSVLGYVQYVPSRVWKLRLLFSKVDLEEFDTVIDLGCGAGRVIRWLLRRGFRGEIYGIEIDPRLVSLARAAFAGFDNVRIVQGDMCESLPRLDGHSVLLYAYNPRRREPMQRLKTRIESSYAAGCSVTMCYLDAAQIELFLADPLWNVDVLEDRHPSPLRTPGCHFAAIMRLRNPIAPRLAA
jgi:SAM-dependent methyltransferase